MTIYMVTATVSHDGKDGWSRTASLPTFFLNSDIQGIVSADHAERIARAMLADVVRVAGEHSDTATAARMASINVDARALDE